MRAYFSLTSKNVASKGERFGLIANNDERQAKPHNPKKPKQLTNTVENPQDLFPLGLFPLTLDLELTFPKIK